MANCSSISICGRISVQVNCLTNIYKGEDSEIEFQFFDKNSEILELDEYDNIEAYLYNEVESYIASYKYPYDEKSYTLMVLPNGVAKINIPSYITSSAVSGKIFIEFKLLKTESVTGEEDNIISTVILPCIQIANLFPSFSNTIPKLSTVTISTEEIIKKDNKIKELEDLIEHLRSLLPTPNNE